MKKSFQETSSWKLLILNFLSLKGESIHYHIDNAHGIGDGDVAIFVDIGSGFDERSRLIADDVVGYSHGIGGIHRAVAIDIT